MAFDSLQSLLEGALSVLGSSSVIATNIIVALLLLIIGVFVGKLSKWLLKKIFVSLLKLDNGIRKHAFNDFFKNRKIQ